jgi:hypothetical protein
MKSILLAFILSVSALNGYSQKNTIIGVFAGGGIASTSNYNVALSGGIDYAKGLNLRSFIGVEVFYQQFSLLYDNEINSNRHAQGSEGEIIMHKTAYAFIAPKFRFCLGRRQNNHFYFSAGVGMNMGGYDSLRRFNTLSTPSGYKRFDTTYDMSKNINSMVLRIGVGCTQHLIMGNHWRFTFTEDFGFLPGSLTKTGGFEDVNRGPYSVGKLNPTYASIRIGIAHTKFP